MVIWMFPKIGIPQNWMVKIMENPIKMDDLGVPLFLETPIYTLVNINMAGWKVDPDWRCFILLEIGIFHCYVSLPEFFSMGQTTTLQFNSRINQAKQKVKVFGKWKWLPASPFFGGFHFVVRLWETGIFSNSSQWIQSQSIGLGYYFEGLGFEAGPAWKCNCDTHFQLTHMSKGSHMGLGGGSLLAFRVGRVRKHGSMKMSRSDQNSDLHFSKFYCIYSLLIWWQSTVDEKTATLEPCQQSGGSLSSGGFRNNPKHQDLSRWDGCFQEVFAWNNPTLCLRNCLPTNFQQDRRFGPLQERQASAGFICRVTIENTWFISSQDGRKWLGSPWFISHEHFGQFGRGPTTRSLGDETDHHGLSNHIQVLGMTLAAQKVPGCW